MFHCYVYYPFHCYVHYLFVRRNIACPVVEKDSSNAQPQTQNCSRRRAHQHVPAGSSSLVDLDDPHTDGGDEPPASRTRGPVAGTHLTHTPAAQPNPSTMRAGPQPGTGQQTQSGGHAQTPTTSHQQQPVQQNCGPIHPADGWPATHGGTFANTPWLPPWIANQHPNPAGGYTPMAATQFQWQATHPASNGAMVTSWGGYSLAPGAAQYQAPHGQPAVVFPPPQNSIQMLPQPATYGGQHPPSMQSQQQQQPQQGTARATQPPPGLPQTFRPHQPPPTSLPGSPHNPAAAHVQHTPTLGAANSSDNTARDTGTLGKGVRPRYRPLAHPVRLPARANPTAAATVGSTRKPATKPSICQQPTLVANTRAGSKPVSRVSHHPCSETQAGCANP